MIQIPLRSLKKSNDTPVIIILLKLDSGYCRPTASIFALFAPWINRDSSLVRKGSNGIDEEDRLSVTRRRKGGDVAACIERREVRRRREIVDWRTDAQHDREARCIAFANPRHGWQYNTPLCKQQQHRWCCSCLATPSPPLHLSMRVCTGHTAWEHVLVPVCIRERVLVHRWGDTRAYERGTRGALRSTSTSRHLTLRSVRFSNHGGSIWMDEFRYLPSIQVSLIVPRYKRNERRGETSIVPSIVASFFLLFFLFV